MTEKSFFIKFLLFLPWLLAGLFVVSFFWDFDGYEITIFKYELALSGILLYTSISGLIGFLTNWIAIQMLFYPRKRRPLLGQGLIPAQKEKIADRLAIAVERDLLQVESIKSRLLSSGKSKFYAKKLIEKSQFFLSDDAIRNDIQDYVNQYIKAFLSDQIVQERIKNNAEKLLTQSLEKKKLEKTALRVYLLIKGKQLSPLLEEVIKSLPERVDAINIPFDQLIKSIPEKLNDDIELVEKLIVQLIEQIIPHINIRQIVQENLQSYDELKLEKIVKNATDAQLSYIKYLGAFIGMFGGLVIWNPLLSLSLLILLGILIISIDVALIHFK